MKTINVPLNPSQSEAEKFRAAMVTIGGRYNGTYNYWMLPDEKHAEAVAIRAQYPDRAFSAPINGATLRFVKGLNPSTIPITMKTAQIELKPASLGSISHGTLRTEDLLSAFISELEWQVSRNGDYFSRPENFGERDKLANLIGEAQDCFSEDGNEIDADKGDEASDLVNETLPDVLNRFAGPYQYFGSHEGDGSDFGYWPDMMAIEDLPAYDNTDAAKEAGEENDFRVVNDHGNVEIYSASGESILGIV